MDSPPLFERDTYCILGLPFDAVTMDSACGRIRQSMQLKKKLFLSTPNVNWLRTASGDAAFRDAALRSDLCIADGAPIVWIARLLSLPIRARTAGSDLIDQLATTTRFSVFFFGGEAQAAQTATANINATQLPMRAAGGINPGHGDVDAMSSADMLGQINAQPVDFLIVSLGAIKGQRWITRNLDHVSATVISHLGAVVNFYAGTVTRAPSAIQKFGLEWLWRIFQEPKLFSRYFSDAVFLLTAFFYRVVPHLIDTVITRYFFRHRKPFAVEGLLHGDEFRMTISGDVVDRDMQAIRTCCVAALRSERNLCIDLTDCGRISPAFLGSLLVLRGQCDKMGRTLRLDNPGSAVKRMLFFCSAEYLLTPNKPGVS